MPKNGKVEERQVADQKASKVDQVLKALADLESLKTGAIEELLAERTAIDEKLAKLGYISAPKKATKTGVTRTRAENAPCGVCKFVTKPNHDGRAHRSQKEKKPFTAAELKELALEKV